LCPCLSFSCCCTWINSWPIVKKPSGNWIGMGRKILPSCSRLRWLRSWIFSRADTNLFKKTCFSAFWESILEPRPLRSWLISLFKSSMPTCFWMHSSFSFFSQPSPDFSIKVLSRSGVGFLNVVADKSFINSLNKSASSFETPFIFRFSTNNFHRFSFIAENIVATFTAPVPVVCAPSSLRIGTGLASATFSCNTAPSFKGSLLFAITLLPFISKTLSKGVALSTFPWTTSFLTNSGKDAGLSSACKANLDAESGRWLISIKTYLLYDRNRSRVQSSRFWLLRSAFWVLRSGLTSESWTFQPLNLSTLNPERWTLNLWTLTYDQTALFFSLNPKQASLPPWRLSGYPQ